MSAFVVNLSWYHNGERHILDNSTADEVGQMLLDECVKSVCYRYDGSEMTNLPGRIDAEWLIPFKHHFHCHIPTPVQALSIISCYEYQSCEHPEWEASSAKALCDRLRREAIHRLPGYDDAPWEWDDPLYYSTDRPVRIV